MKIEVKGHSGCRIEIVNEGERLYISKSTHDVKYIDRLHKQGIKQIRAAKNTYRHMRVPEIFAVEGDNTHLELKMEYVYGKNFIDYFEDAGFEKINYFTEALKTFVNKEIEESDLQEVSLDVVREKFKDIHHKCMKNSLLKEDCEINFLLNRCCAIIESLPMQMRMPIGSCHGDLTFSNIIFNGNNYYLIDFLDSFIESPLLDLVKIRQDSCYGWSRLMYEGDVDDVRLDIISKKIDTEIDKYYKRYDWYLEYYSVFQLINFLRVLQYVQRPDVKEYLTATIKNLI